MAFSDIGPALAMVRRQRGLSQGELAERCRMGRGQLSRYESGRVHMRVDILEKVLSELGMPPDEFFLLVGSLDHSPALSARARPSPVDGRVVAEAFMKLHAAIDEVRAVVEHAIDPAVRFARLIDEAAASRRPKRNTGDS